MWRWATTRTARAGSRSSASPRPKAARAPAAGARDAAAVPDHAAKPDALVVFMPSGRRGRFPIGTPLLQAARSLGVDIDSVCGGRGICGRCQVELAEGEFAKLGVTSAADHLSG